MRNLTFALILLAIVAGCREKSVSDPELNATPHQKAKNASIDDLNGLCDIILASPVSNLADSKYSECKGISTSNPTDWEGPVKEIVLRVNRIVKGNDFVGGGRFEFYCADKGVTIFGKPVKRIVVHWVRDPLNIEVPIVDSVFVNYAERGDKEFTDAVAVIIRGKYGFESQIFPETQTDSQRNMW